jgi:O-antigen/teichoic acid export membrane protein
VSLGLGLRGAAAGYTLGAMACWGVAFALFRRLKLPRAERPSERIALPLVRFSAPVSGMVVLGTALLWLDALLLGAFRSAGEVAVYGLVVRMLLIGSGILAALVQAFGPLVTQLLAMERRRHLQDILRGATRWSVALSAPLLTLVMLVGGHVLAALGQPAGRGAAAAVILGVAFLVDASTGPVGHVLTMSGRSWLNFVNNAVALVSNVLLNLLLIPSFGLLGAAASWAVVIVGLNVVRVFQVRSLFGITPLGRSLWKPLVASGTAAAAVVALGPTLAGAGLRPVGWIGVVTLLFSSVYGLTILGLGLEAPDWLLVRALLRKKAGQQGEATSG